MLGEIRGYLRERGSASLREISLHFDTSTDAAELALTYWMNKGKVQLVTPSCDSDCTGCPGSEALYCWTEPEKPIKWHRRRP